MWRSLYPAADEGILSVHDEDVLGGGYLYHKKDIVSLTMTCTEVQAHSQEVLYSIW